MAVWIKPAPSAGGGEGGGLVDSVNGQIGAVTLSASDVGAVPIARTINTKALSSDVTLNATDVGLGEVDNTADADKPISTATATALAAKADLVGGLIPSAQLPPLAINETYVVANESAMLTLTAQRGDVAVRTDLDPDGVFILTADAPGTLSNWTRITAAGTVTAVAGKTGNVSLVSSDVGLGNVDNTSDAAKPISTAAAAALAGKADLVGGLVPTSQIPPLAVNETFVVASQSAMLALTAQRGDVAVRTDNSRTYILATDSPSTLADWKELTAAGQVLSVAGKTGTVSLVKADVGLSNVDNTSDASKPVSTAQAAAIAAAVVPSTDDDNLITTGTDGKLHLDGSNIQPAGTYLTPASLDYVGNIWVLEAGEDETDVPAGFPASSGTRWSVVLRKTA